MSDRTNSKQTQFDNLSYIPDGRDRIGFSNNPQKSSSTNSNNRDLILQAKDLARTDTVYRYRTGHDSIYAYSNAAFSDVSQPDSRGPSIRTQISNYYRSDKIFRDEQSFCRFFITKYWFLILIFLLIILIGIGVTVGVLISRSKSEESQCLISCNLGEKVVQINSTHCDCQLRNKCESDPPACYPLDCVPIGTVGYECKCTPGFQHPPSSNDLTICQDVNECLTPGICGLHQLCNNTDGSYHCFCSTGYETVSTPNGIICVDKNECLDGSRCTNGQCHNTNGSFVCVCEPGFIKDLFHPLFCEDIDECLQTFPCNGANEICQNTVGSFRCLCAPGFERNEQNQCININECSNSNSICDKNSRCEDRIGSFACCVASVTDRCLECGFEYGGRRQKRMVNGNPVFQRQFPWVAALFVKSIYYEHEPRYVCAASLISSWNLVTAAHCLDEQHFRNFAHWELTSQPNSFKDIFEIRIGVYNISSTSDEFRQSRSYTIANFTLHPEYRSLTNENMIVSDDIALIRLNERVERSSDQDWICLPPSMQLNDKSVLKVVSYDRFTDDHSVQTQLDVEVLHSPNSVRQCQQQLTDLAIDAFCTMSTSSSAFLGVGDSGAGSMLSINQEQWHLVGIMSRQGLYQKNYSAMTNVSMHLQWLKSLVEK